jgi:hypothetical protein
VDLQDEVRQLRSLVDRLREGNARLTQLLRLAPRESAAPGPSQTGMFDRAPGMVDARSSPDAKVALFQRPRAQRHRGLDVGPVGFGESYERPAACAPYSAWASV